MYKHNKIIVNISTINIKPDITQLCNIPNNKVKRLG